MFIDEYDHQELSLDDLKVMLEDTDDDNLKSVEVKDGVLTFEYFDKYLEKIETYDIDFNNLYTEVLSCPFLSLYK